MRGSAHRAGDYKQLRDGTRYVVRLNGSWVRTTPKKKSARKIKMKRM